MKIPSFDEFRATLTEERILEIQGGYDFEEKLPAVNFNDSASVSAFISSLGMAVIAQSTIANLRFLGAYHEWLSLQIQNQD